MNRRAWNGREAHGGSGDAFRTGWEKRKGGGVLAWCHAAEGVGGGGGDHGQWEAGTDPGTAGMGGARRGFKTGQGSNGVQIQINLN
jgi:hypothetical protein